MIAIIGYGIVGKATHQLINSSDVITFDVDNMHKFPDRKYECSFICIPTATKDDLQITKDLCLHALKYSRIVVIRSTIPVGYFEENFSDYLERMAYCPEFLRERMYEQDVKDTPIIIGANGPVDIDWIFADKTLFHTSITEAEILKMMNNSYGALRVVFANHMYNLANRTGANYERIRHLYRSVEHKDQDYFTVHENMRGFGGKCLPKDLDFLIDTFIKHNLPQTFLTAIKEDNKLWPTTVRKD